MESVVIRSARQQGDGRKRISDVAKGVCSPNTGGSDGECKNRKVVQGVRGDVVAYLSSFRLEQGHGIGDRDAFISRADLQVRIHAYRRRDLYNQVSADEFLEAGYRNGWLASGFHWQLSDGVIACRWCAAG